MTTATATPGLDSAAMDVSSGFANMTGLSGAVLGVLVLSVLVMALMRSPSVYAWLVEQSRGLALSVRYAVLGVVVAGIIGVVAAPIYWIATADPGTQTAIGRYAGYAVAGYVVLVGLGYVGEYAWERLATQHERVTGHRPFEEWDTGGDKA